MSSSTVFYIGANAVSQPYQEGAGDWPPVDMVVMRPCTCESHFQDESDIPKESLDAAGLTEKELREVMEDVGAAFERRTRCCWYWGWCCPLMLFIWWLDMCCQQWKCGPTKWCCYKPAMKEVNSILEKHNQKLQAKGVTLSVVSDYKAAHTSSTEELAPFVYYENKHTVHFDTWLIQVLCGSQRISGP